MMTNLFRIQTPLFFQTKHHLNTSSVRRDFGEGGGRRQTFGGSLFNFTLPPPARYAPNTSKRVGVKEYNEYPVDLNII
jgi:hypothetical protein